MTRNKAWHKALEDHRNPRSLRPQAHLIRNHDLPVSSRTNKGHCYDQSTQTTTLNMKMFSLKKEKVHLPLDHFVLVHLKKNNESFELKTDITFLLTPCFSQTHKPRFTRSSAEIKCLGFRCQLSPCFSFLGLLLVCESRESGIGSVIPVQMHFNPHAGIALRCWCDPGFYPLTVINLAALRVGLQGTCACVFVSRR